MSKKTAPSLDRVIDCISATTRYPRQVLTPESDLENDLGIDSVKRVEIVAALGIEFDLDLTSQTRDPSIRTIQDIVSWIEDLSRATSPAVTANAHLNGSHQPNTNHVSQVPVAPAPAQPVANGKAESKQPISLLERSGSAHTQVESRFTYVNGSHDVAEPKMPALQPSINGSSYHRPLEGKVAFITGSGRGVGRTIGRVLAMQGASIIVNSFHSREMGEQATAEIVAQGGKAYHVWGSVANSVHVDNMFDEIEQRFGKLDILVCNASDGRIGSFTEVTGEDWDRAFRTNVSGHHQCAMRAARLMQPQGGGAIITMSSIAASRYVEGLGGQGVVKAAVESLTRYLACELAPHGIRTNCVSGGPVYGQVMSMYPEARSTLSYWETLVTDGELCSPLDLANTVAFLVSDQARGVNGAVWRVDHGLATRSHSRPLPRPTSNAVSPTFTSR